LAQAHSPRSFTYFGDACFLGSSMSSITPAWVVSDDGSSQELHTDISACPISHVAVFSDRAEVTRLVSFTPSGVGEASLVLSGLTQKADTETIRVNRTGGRCSILEVSFEVRHRVVKPDVDAAGKREAHVAEVKRLQGLVSSKKAEHTRLQQARLHLEAYLKTLVTESKVSELEHVGQALDFYGQRAGALDESLAACDREQAELEASLEAATANCRAAGEGLKVKTEASRDVTVQLDVLDAEEELSLSVVYMVCDASWSPSYDLRVSSCDGDAAPSLSLTYFALVKHATGEDWKGCHMSLSTATPSKSGVAPTPARKLVRFHDAGRAPVAVAPSRRQQRMMPQQAMMGQQALMPQQAMTNALMGQQAMMQPNMMMQQAAMEVPPQAGNMVDVESEEEPTPEAKQTAVADTGAGNVSFAVERKVSINADNQPHKVTIAVLDLKPRFMYFTTPEQEEKVYMQVRVMNDSSYKLLASSKVAVFFNGSFVTTTQIGDTNPGEEINTFLGQDTSVKVEYKKLKTQHSQATGFMSHAQSTKYSFLTAVTNTKKVPVSVKVVGCVPRSNTDSIQVQLERPKPEEIVSEKDARGDNVTMQNAVTNNIVWVRKVEPGQKIELPLDYKVAWPKDRQIEIGS